jgi:hypothetical protein
MVKRNVTYVNFDNVEVTDALYFNLTEAELLDIELRYGGDVSKQLELLKDRKDIKGQFDIVKDIIVTGYGEKNSDGRFIKNRDIRDSFVATGAFSQLLVDLLSNENALADFLRAMAPNSLHIAAESEKEA